jgi:hypothetical protein
MPIVINKEKYYYTSEACTLAGIAKNTFLRWVADGAFTEVQYRDGRGWRLFDEKELARLISEVTRRNSVNSITKNKAKA